MITEEQYQAALTIIDEYEKEQMRLNDFDDDFEDEPEECDDCGRLNCICEYVNGCTCGAWRWGNSGPVHVADCICGGGL